MRRKVLLLGATGQLGCAVRRLHAKAGEPFDLLAPGREALDLAAPESVEPALRALAFDTLVNCAAWTRVDDAEDNLKAALAVNAHAVGALARACAAKRARLVHVGTDYVFGGDPEIDRPLGEDAPAAPVNAYGRSKEMGERLARAESDDVVIVRVAALFGTAGAPRPGRSGPAPECIGRKTGGGSAGNFVETVLRAARTKGTLRVVDDQTVSPTAAADAARAVLRMLTEGCPPGLYHAVDTGQATWFELAREVVRRARIDASVTPCASAQYPTRAVRPRYSALDNAKISAAFGPLPPWQEALERYLRERRRRDGL